MKTDNTKWPQTTDYDMFVLSDKNRKINAVNLKHLKSAIQKAGEIIYPITIRPSESNPGKYEIMDGQHRYLICRALRLPVKYQVKPDMTYRDALDLNNTGCKNKLLDILHVGGFTNESCRIAEELVEEYSDIAGNLKPAIVLRALGVKSGTSTKLIDKLTIDSKEIPSARRCLLFIRSILGETPRGRRRDLYEPLVDILKDNEGDIDLKRLRNVLVNKTIPNNKEVTRDGWVKAIDHDYNKGLNTENKVDILVNYTISQKSHK